MIFKRLSARADTGIPGFLICGAYAAFGSWIIPPGAAEEAEHRVW
jgi:cobyric acid synthase